MVWRLVPAPDIYTFKLSKKPQSRAGYFFRYPYSIERKRKEAQKKLLCTCSSYDSYIFWLVVDILERLSFLSSDSINEFGLLLSENEIRKC